MKNTELKKRLKETNIYQWEVAEKMGISEMTLVRRLRKELPAEEKQKIFSIINELVIENNSKKVETEV